MIRNTAIFRSLLGLLSFFNRRHHLVAASRLRNVRSSLLFLILLFAIPAQAAQTDIAGPAGSGRFGSAVTVLPNGNFVVNDSFYSIPGGAANVGAVYLYDATTLKIISTLTGSAANDRVGSGITVLTNGNYVVSSIEWHIVGAVTWCSATTGCSGVVSANNSLIGGTAYDGVGDGGIKVLANGNYLVNSPDWDNPAGAKADAGAVTCGNGTGGTVGLVTSSNSLIGGSANDQVGRGITVLTNGNYVVSSPFWDNPTGPTVDVGAVTWGNGSGGTVGLISASNSLIGGRANDTDY